MAPLALFLLLLFHFLKFKFSSLDNEIGLTVNETLPIRISGPSDIRRFSQCNQTQNMFFVSNKCSTSS